MTCGALMLGLPQIWSLKNGKRKWSTFMFTNIHKWIILLFIMHNLLQKLVYFILPHIRRIQGWLSSSGAKLFLSSWEYCCMSYLTTPSAAIQTHHVGKWFLECQQELSRLGGFRQKSKDGTEEREIQFCLFICLSFLKVANWPSKIRQLLVILLPSCLARILCNFTPG